MPAPADDTFSPEIFKFAEKLAEDPRSKVFVPLAEEYVKVGMLQEAIDVLEQGLKVYPTFITALVALGRVYRQKGVVSKAKAALEGAVKLSPENLVAHRTLARIYLEEGALESAMRSCSVVLTANRKDEEILALKATIEQQLGLNAASRSHATANAAASAKASSPAHDATSNKVARLREWLANIQQKRVC